jgi:tryptophan-rich sensory protein
MMASPGSKADVLRFVVSLAAPLLVGAIGGIATAQSVVEWYPALAKPWFTPPPWLFGPVWTALYVAMGVALFLVWRGGLTSPECRVAVAVFAVQLALNVAWSPVFFGLRAPGAGLLVILVLDVAVVATIVAFRRVSKAAAWLLVPYLAWVLFASALNFEIWRLNAG